MTRKKKSKSFEKVLFLWSPPEKNRTPFPTVSLFFNSHFFSVCSLFSFFLFHSYQLSLSLFFLFFLFFSFELGQQ